MHPRARTTSSVTSRDNRTRRRNRHNVGESDEGKQSANTCLLVITDFITVGHVCRTHTSLYDSSPTALSTSSSSCALLLLLPPPDHRRNVLTSDFPNVVPMAMPSPMVTPPRNNDTSESDVVESGMLITRGLVGEDCSANGTTASEGALTDRQAKHMDGLFGWLVNYHV